MEERMVQREEEVMMVVIIMRVVMMVVIIVRVVMVVNRMVQQYLVELISVKALHCSVECQWCHFGIVPSIGYESALITQMVLPYLCIKK